MRRSSTGLLVIVALVAGSGSARVAYATSGECLRGIVAGYPNYERTSIKKRQKCQDAIIRGAHPAGYDCDADPLTLVALASAESNLRKKIGDACGGNNHRCNAADTGHNADESLASIGWDIGSCPNFESAACTNAIGDCGEIVDCMACINSVAQSQMIALLDGQLQLSTTDHALTRCQREIGKRGIEFYWKKLKRLEKCERKVLSGDVTPPCPDADAVSDIGDLEAKMRENICNKCGGTDKHCGGSAADRTPSEIGFVSSCPNVTIPGGPSCGGNITTLDDVIDCVACVSEFKVDCLEAMSVPGAKSYPPECNVAP